MSIWENHHVEAGIVDVLRDVPLNNDAHAFGRPFLTAYQLAIELDRRYPDVRAALGYRLGGAGVGDPNSLAQYLAQQLSRRIGDARSAGASYPIEGGFVSNVNVGSITYRSHDGTEIVSSLTGTGYDLSMFRLA